MLDKKIITILAMIVFLLISCEEKSLEVSVTSEHELGHETANIQDYFYDFDEKVDAQYLYYNLYATRGVNTFDNMNPYIDTLNFSTFPSYIVAIDNQLDTIGYQLALTADNVDQYATLYPLNELNTSENNWCNNVLVQYQSDCPTEVEVDFDYSLSLSSATGKVIDTVSSQSVFEEILSRKSVDFDVSWTNTTSIFWDSNNERYDVITPDSSEALSATICAGICDSTKLNSALPLCDESFGSSDNTACYDPSYVIQNEIENLDYFDSLIFIGTIDTNRIPLKVLCLLTVQNGKGMILNIKVLINPLY